MTGPLSHTQRTGDRFRWRSHEITRIEGFSDAVFGFAVTLLVISLEVPKTSTELLEVMHGLPAFAATFSMLASIWYAQYRWFRRYGLEDTTSVVLNLALLFTAVAFMYPLKFFFAALFVDPGLHQSLQTPHGPQMVVAPGHRPWLFAMFGLAFCAVSAILLLLYRHAWKKRVELALDENEAFETRQAVQRWALSIAVGAVYLVLAIATVFTERTVRLAILLVALLAFLVIAFAMLGQLRARKRFRAAHPAGPVDAPAGDGRT
jgi:uncharacterized membrane protein